ncbi:MAG: phosphotransferase [Oscillospiraceae bacterium]
MLLHDIVNKIPINKGWSCDKKYCVTVSNGTKYLLRITPAGKSATRKALFTMLEKVATLGVPMCRPVEFGVCDEGVYTLYTWIDGTDAQDYVPLLPAAEQYAFGFKAGELLKRIHSIPAPAEQEDWQMRFNRKTDYKIQKYNACGIRFHGDSHVMGYLKNNRDVFRNRPKSFQHGDYHIGNMMIENGTIIIIDFDRYDFGDPWEEFNRIIWCAQPAPYFATGMIDGYFDGKPPLEFWKCLAFYIGSNTLSSIYWAIDFGQSDLDVMMKQSQDVLMWYDNFHTVIPSWYTKMR